MRLRLDTRFFEHLIAIPLFLLFFSSFLSIRVWDYDFWWHIATGRYIVQHREISTEDRFSFVTNKNRDMFPATALREKFLMRQYWLAQVIFYYIYNTFGSWGIAATRALLLTLTLWLLYKGLRMFDVSRLLSFCLLIPVFYILIHKYTGERPVLFTFLFAILTFLIIERSLKTQGRIIYILPPVMMVWANLHGGFILGVVFILVYLISETIRFIMRKSTLSKDRFYKFSLTMIISIIFAVINPNGFLVILMFKSKYKIFKIGVQEYLPLYTFYIKKVWGMDYSVLFIVVITAFVLLVRNLRMHLPHLIILAGLFIISILHQRFFAFTATVGMMITGKEITELYKKVRLNRKVYIMAGRVILLLFIASFITKFITSSVKYWKNFKSLSGTHEIVLAKEAIDFIEKNRIPGRMFNTDIAGGYATWRLYPWKQVFTDTRAIDIASWVEYKNIISANPAMVGEKPLWERLLDMYEINIVLTNARDYYGNLLPLVREILENERWRLVFTDGEFLIFLRNNEDNRTLINRYRLKKEDGYWSIIAATSYQALHKKNNPFFYKTIAYCFMRLKNYNEALKALGHTLRLNPDDKEALAMVKEIQELRQKERSKKT